MTVRYQLNGDDCLECLRVHNPRVRSKAVRSVLLSLVVIALGALGLTLPGGKGWAWLSIGFGAAILIVGPLSRLYLVSRIRKQWSQMDPMELVVGETGFASDTRGAQSDVKWSRFLRLRESRQHFMLYQSADLYQIIPKRGFVGEEDLARFREIATRGMGST
jgi:YcxB-like protein